MQITGSQILLYLILFGIASCTSQSLRIYLIPVLSISFYLNATRDISIVFIGLIAFFSIGSFIRLNSLLSYNQSHLDQERDNLIKKISVTLIVLTYIFYIFSVSPIFDFTNLNIFYVKFSSLSFFGIGFIVLQAISLATSRVHLGDASKLRLSAISLSYLFFPPQLAAGPVEKVEDLLPQFENQRFQIDFGILAESFSKISFGLIKKVLFLPYIHYFIMSVGQINLDFNFLHLLYFIICLPLSYLYFYQDIQAYTLIAQGLGLICGIRLSDNFNSPHTANSFTEFWSRWHITVSRWFFANISRPIVKLLTKHFLSRCLWIAPTLTFLIYGIWHGFSLYSVVSGLILALLFVLERKLRKKKLMSKKINFLVVQLTAAILCYYSLIFGYSLSSPYNLSSFDMSISFVKALVSFLALILLGLEKPRKALSKILLFKMTKTQKNIFLICSNAFLISILMPSWSSFEYIRMQ